MNRRGSDLQTGVLRGSLLLLALCLHETRDALVLAASAVAPLAVWIAERLS